MIDSQTRSLVNLSSWPSLGRSWLKVGRVQVDRGGICVQLRHSIVRLLLVLTAGLQVACATPDPKAGRDVNSPAAGTLNCGDPIDELDKLPSGYSSVLDVAAFSIPTRLERGSGGIDSKPDLRFSKFALLVRESASFEVAVGSASHGSALVHWGNVGQADPVDSFAVRACHGRKPWLVYPGGIWTAEVGCVSLVVRTPTAAAEVRIPVGVHC